MVTRPYLSSAAQLDELMAFVGVEVVPELVEVKWRFPPPET